MHEISQKDDAVYRADSDVSILSSFFLILVILLFVPDTL